MVDNKGLVKDLQYYKTNAEEDYVSTPISVLRYISELENALQVTQIHKTLTAEQYIRRLYPLSDKFSRLGCEKIAESYANLKVEQAKEEWDKHNFTPPVDLFSAPNASHYELCECNPKNGGSGVCGCTLGGIFNVTC